MYTLDTNSVIYYLKGDAKAAPLLRAVFSEDVPIYVSAITEAELFSFSGLTDEESVLIDEILSTVAIIALDSRLARTTGSLRRNYKLDIADAVIAATALFTNSRLVTRNVKDFRKISNLLLYSI